MFYVGVEAFCVALLSAVDAICRPIDTVWPNA